MALFFFVSRADATSVATPAARTIPVYLLRTTRAGATGHIAAIA